MNANSIITIKELKEYISTIPLLILLTYDKEEKIVRINTNQNINLLLFNKATAIRILNPEVRNKPINLTFKLAS